MDLFPFRAWIRACRIVDDVRTSSTAWLSSEAHSKDPVVVDIENRIADITNTPAVNQARALLPSRSKRTR